MAFCCCAAASNDHDIVAPASVGVQEVIPNSRLGLAEDTEQIEDDSSSLAPRDFDVELDKTAALGLCIDTADDERVIVKRVEATGLLHEWNRKCPADKIVQPNDRISKINDIAVKAVDLTSPTSKILLAGSAPLKLSIQRPTVRICKLKKPGSYGLQLGYKQSSTGLAIKNIQSGLLQDWNLANPTRAIENRDRIVAINEQSGTAPELLKRLSVLSEVSLTILHYSD
eukprot:TRINITY_DN113929_c0_g1_i1.p1 TRINITY_DN113929_c0_g1~~TRINITY_DN113929_c0_g1_i1.p1  ORF type:complete len:227 (+),score=37.04 TRINITY_DN113929_c0_g1_i1:215-895(+)